MSSKTAALIGAIVVALLLIEIVGNLIHNYEEKEQKNPIDSSGKIKDGYTISLEEEEQMAKESFPEVSEEEYNDQLMFAISQCILTSANLNSYECIGNNIGDSYFSSEEAKLSSDEKGKIIYKQLVKNFTPSGVTATLIEGQKQVYNLEIFVLESKNPFNYEITIDDRKITVIKEKEGNK